MADDLNIDVKVEIDGDVEVELDIEQVQYETTVKNDFENLKNSKDEQLKENTELAVNPEEGLEVDIELAYRSNKTISQLMEEKSIRTVTENDAGEIVDNSQNEISLIVEANLSTD